MELAKLTEQNVEESKIQDLQVLSNDQKKELLGGLPYLPIPYMPITEEFAAKYILNDVEYPIIEGKLSQAAIEMRSRFNNLIDSNYEYQKIELEIEEMNIDIEDLKKKTDISPAKMEIEIRRKELDKQIKIYRLFSIKQGLESTYKDYLCWKNMVESCINLLKEQDPNIKSINDIQFDKIRVAEMSVKVQRWLEMSARGEELTQPQKILIYDQYLKNRQQQSENPQT